MTAEVALLNREAAVLAADSATTVAGYGQQKIYNSENKIFSLSFTEPVAAMVFNVGSLGPIPWETVIKEHRREYSTEPCSSVEQYSDRLVGSLTHILAQYAPNFHLQHTVNVVNLELDRLREQVLELVSETFSSGERISLEDAGEFVPDLIDERISQLEQTGDDVEISVVEIDNQIDQAIPQLSDYIGPRLVGLFPDDDALVWVRQLIRAALLHSGPHDLTSGLVVTGFGKDELFPSIIEHRIFGFGDGIVLNRLVDHQYIDEDCSAIIRPFAQDDMVSMFLHGIEPRFKQVVHSSVLDAMKSMVDVVVKSLELDVDMFAESIQRLNQSGIEISRKFDERIENYMLEKHSGPIEDVVGMLPKEELAELAEALVNITSIHRRVMPVAETVGGPCDVAIISKGDGLVWAKRKHYFPPELNPRFFRRDESALTRYAIDQEAGGGTT